MKGFAQTTEERVKSQARAERAANDLRWVMSDERGRRFVYALLDGAGIFRTTFNPLARNALADMAFAEGRKDLGYRLLDRLGSLCPEAYDLMMKEHRNDRTRQQSRTGEPGTE